jgi:hypothetical protein
MPAFAVYLETVGVWTTLVMAHRFCYRSLKISNFAVNIHDVYFSNACCVYSIFFSSLPHVNVY